MKFHKFYWCPVCEEERVFAVEGEISAPPNPYAIGPGPKPDVVRATAAWGECGHEADLGAAQEMLEGIAQGEMV